MKDQAERLRQVIDNLKLTQSINRVGAPEPKVRSSARVITVTSGKGGVGKTNITINLAIALAEQGLRIVIMDADFGLANIDVLFGIFPQFSLLDVIKGRKNILEIMSEGPKNVRFISGGSGVEELVKLEKVQVMRFVENISMLDMKADIIFVDTGAGLSENVMSFVMAADEVLLVTTPEPTSITDAYALIKTVANRDKSKKIKVIVNKAETIAEANDLANKLMLVAEKFLGISLESLGYVLSDDSVVKAVKQQQPFLLSFPKSPAARLIKGISDKLIENGNSVQDAGNIGFRGFINRLVGFMKA